MIRPMTHGLPLRATGRSVARTSRGRLAGTWLTAVLVLLVTLCGCRLDEGRAGVEQAVSEAKASLPLRSETAPGTVSVLTGNPFQQEPVYLPRQQASHAVNQAATREEERLLTRLAEVPTAVWLLPEQYPVGGVGDHVADLVMQADDRHEVPVFVIYGIPGRDCTSGHSGGGFADSGQYLAWVREIAENAGPGAVVILEPDALASAGQCLGHGERLDVLRRAVEVLAAGPVTYVDAGHSRWRDAGTTVELLRAVGVDRVRGFSLNVAGYGSESDERAHGDRIADQLHGSHFVVDTGRSGAGTNGEWCNPSGRALGPLPGPVPGDGPMDARLWVKPPGESDGTCGGGPTAGSFWKERAVELARAAGW